MDSVIFPRNFPADLVLAAFKTRNEAAWPPALAASAVGWLGKNGYAVLGTELWLLQGASIKSLPIGLSGTREVHGNTVNREIGEVWSAFVARAAAETGAYLQSFKALQIVEPGELYFNIIWVSENEFDNLGSSV